jgi:hypothetical protein
MLGAAGGETPEIGGLPVRLAFVTVLSPGGPFEETAAQRSRKGSPKRGDDGMSAWVNRAPGGAVEHWVDQLVIEAPSPQQSSTRVTA